MDYDVTTFGAKGDGVSDDTSAIQAAIDCCCAAGGGRVTFPGGRIYRSGTLILGSNLELHLQMGALLKGSDRLEDYLLYGTGEARPGKRDVPSYINSDFNGAPTHFFLYGKNLENLAITGFGSIDGNEEIFYGEQTPWHIEGAFYPRAPLVFLENVEKLTITQVTLQRSAFWTLHMVGCSDVLIDGIRIRNNLRMANCDGIDPDHCRNVRIANCHIECADDCIVFKNTAAAVGYGPCENITVSNCTLTSTSAAIKFGSESESLFRNILVENCVISRSNRGISLQLRDKGSIENVAFHNISIGTRLFHPEKFWGQAEPIAITVLPRREGTAVGTVRNVRFSNIFAEAENGILLWGEGEETLSGVSFDRVSLELRRKTDYEPGSHDLRPCGGQTTAGDGLCYVRAHNASRVAFRDCSFSADESMENLLREPFILTGCRDFAV